MDKKCIFYHWQGDSPHEGKCVLTEYQARDVAEAQYGQEQMAKGYSQGYHAGLREGYATARYPERCHCCHCRSHGEMCGEIIKG